MENEKESELITPDVEEAIKLMWLTRMNESEEMLKEKAEKSFVHAIIYGEVICLKALLSEDQDEVKESFERLKIRK